MKLKKYENKELRKSKIISFVLGCLCIIFVGLFVYQSYGRYQDNVTFKLINGKLKMSGGSGDIEFAFYHGDQKLDTMPTKNNKEGIVFIKATCTNDASIKWNDADWNNIVVNNLTKTKTNCSLYFGSKTEKICTLAGEKSGACYLAKKSDNDTTNLAYDNTDDANLRYIGATPNNYVYFNCEEGEEASKSTCETWRIIGVINNITEVSEDGKNKETNGSYLKIIRDSIGKYSWDSSAASVNQGYGVNEWSEADIEKVLNDEYLYRRAGSNLCFKDSSNTKETCPVWTSIGIKDKSRSMIANIKWNTGTTPGRTENLWTIKYVYEAERSSNNGREYCVYSGATPCDDKVLRTTTWIGKVGLMYPSDYGYSIGGDVRTICLNKMMNKFNEDNCMENSWLYDTSNTQWTMVPSSLVASYVFYIYMGSGLSSLYASVPCNINPVVYLKSDVKIVERNYDDYGSSSHPFELEY